MIISKQMTKEEYINRTTKFKEHILEKHDDMLYYIANSIFNIGYMEEVCEKLGYTTKRQTLNWTIYSKLFDIKGKEIGIISNQGVPTIEFYKRNKANAIKVSKDKNVIIPIKGVHRVLDWHTVEGKLHILAGGSIILNFIPIEFTDEELQKFIDNSKILELLEKAKKNTL